ncbi:hypothetical protein ACHIPZ_14195 [Antrihabitans sp. NCIMB 15449]|uniref:Uncharacterized protein n=1 Tax=Antrihabitans spumae TaxID=3373370 RepID=A0ABW7JMV2_9NOCA
MVSDRCAESATAKLSAKVRTPSSSIDRIVDVSAADVLAVTSSES